MGSVFPFIPHQVRADATNTMMFEVSRRYGAKLSELMEGFHRYKCSGEFFHSYPYRLNLDPRFGKVPTDPMLFGEDFSITPWRGQLPGSIPVDRPPQPHHDIVDIERYLRGCPVEEREKYDILWRADKLWELYQDCFTTLKIRYFHHKLKRYGELCGIKTPSLLRCVEMVNLLTFGLPHDPRINPLCLPLEMLKDGVLEAAPGYALGPSEDFRRILDAGFGGFASDENPHPELWEFADFIEDIYSNKSPWVFGAQPANVFRVTVKNLLQNRLISLPAPGVSRYADGDIWLRWFMSIGLNSSEGAEQSRYFGNNQAKSFKEELRDLAWFLLSDKISSGFLLSGVEQKALQACSVQWLPKYTGEPVLDFSAARYWSYVADCNKDVWVSRGQIPSIVTANYRDWRFGARLFYSMSKLLLRSEKFEWKDEILDSGEACFRFFSNLKESFGIDVESL